MIGLLNHVEIYVNDLDETKAFWGWLFSLLGWEIYQEWNEGISWRLNNYYIVFVKTKQEYQYSYHRCRPGINHLAFSVNTTDDIDFLVSELTKKNIKILYKEKHPHAGGEDHYAVYF